MSGGGDINPLYIQEEPIPALQDVDTYRDEYDLILLRLAINRQLPVMGICRGHQILNVAFGGDVYQDIHTQHNQKLLKHSQTLPREQVSHSITLSESPSKLRTMLDGEMNFWSTPSSSGNQKAGSRIYRYGDSSRRDQ